MKKVYLIILVSLSVIILSWILPWLYSIVFPIAATEPFVAYSPVSNCFIVSENLGEGKNDIYSLTPDGQRAMSFSREQRDSLLPQIYYTQLIASERMPDSLAGKELSLQNLKHGQWVFTSLPRDINKTDPDIYLMMESMPARIDLEDPKEVFTLHGNVEFRNISNGTINEKRSNHFSETFKDRGFEYPQKSISANITTRKPYDEGYLIADKSGSIYHLKMQAGRPYMREVRLPDGKKAKDVFIMENIDPRELGFVSSEEGDFYVIERDGYRLTKLPIDHIDPRSEKISIMRNIFNWIIKLTDGSVTRWYAIDTDDYHLLGYYSIQRNERLPEAIASYIFPFRLSFTDLNDCYVKPRISNLSVNAVFLSAILALIVFAYGRKRGLSPAINISLTSLTLLMGIFMFIPLSLIKD